MVQRKVRETVETGAPKIAAQFAEAIMNEGTIPASSSGRTPDFGSGNGRSSRPAGAKKAPVQQQPKFRATENMIDPVPIAVSAEALLASLAPKAPSPKRDRKEYQRALMRDKRAAAKAGLTVAEYRERQKSKGGGSE